MTSKLDKVIIPYEANKIENLVYVVQQGSFDWIKEDIISSEGLSIRHLTIKGIYRFTIISEHQFNITHYISKNNQFMFLEKGVNTISIFFYIPAGGDVNGFSFKPVDGTVVRASIRWVLEFVTEIYN